MYIINPELITYVDVVDDSEVAIYFPTHELRLMFAEAKEFMAKDLGRSFIYITKRKS